MDHEFLMHQACIVNMKANDDMMVLKTVKLSICKNIQAVPAQKKEKMKLSSA
jgi:hypothetical protein